MNTSQPVRIVIVDDHETLRHTLRLYLQQFEHLQLVGEAGSGYEALQLCAQQKPDVVLMDILMPGMDGIDATRAIRQEHPDVRVIGMTGMEYERLERDALEAGAAAFLYKGMLDDRLVAAIYQALGGEPQAD